MLLTSSSSDSFSSATVFNDVDVDGIRKDVDVDGIRLKIVADNPVEDNLGAPRVAPTNPLLSLRVVTEPAMDETSSKFLCDTLNILHCFLYTSHSSGKPFYIWKEKNNKTFVERHEKI